MATGLAPARAARSDGPAAGSTPRRGARSLLALAVGLSMLAGAFHVSTIRAGHGWHDDFASYVAHARNITEGRPYADTGYLYNPANSGAGPRTYPPGLPVLLAPVTAISGLDLEPMKVALVVVLSAWLLVLFALIRRRYPGWMAIAVVAFLGFHPFISNFKDNVLSDIPFALFVTLTLLAVERAHAAGAHRASVPLGHALLVGTCMYLAYATRTVGIVLVPTLVLYEAYVHRRVSRFLLGSTITFAVLAAAQQAIMSGGSGVLDPMRSASPRLTVVNLWRYLRSLEGLAVNGYVAGAATILFLFLTSMAAVGFISRLRRDRITPTEVLIPVYVAAVAVWPAFQSLRFLLPIIPFYGLYAILGIRTVCTWERRGVVERVALVGLAGVLAASFLSWYARVDFGPLGEGVGTPETAEMIAFVSGHTHAEDVLIFQRPKALALYAGRPTAGYSPTWTDDQMIDFLREVGASYLIDGSVDHGYLDAFLRRHPGMATLEFANGEHRVYRLERDPSDRRPIDARA